MIGVIGSGTVTGFEVRMDRIEGRPIAAGKATMCSLVILRRPAHRWPLLIGANRDERIDRQWRPPGRHWPDRSNVIAGFDEIGGGSWLGLNDEGVVAAILNREGTLGPAAGKRTRGELVLEALDHADAADAARALTGLDPDAYRPFNMVVADNTDAYWLVHRGTDDRAEARVRMAPIPTGLSLVAAHDLNDDTSARVRRYRPLFAAADAPDPDTGRWVAWETLLAGRDYDPDAGPRGAMCVVTPTGFETVSSSLIALPSVEMADLKPIWKFAPGRPGTVPWQDIALD